MGPGPRSASLSLDEARRIALAAQGFDRPRPARRAGGDRLGQIIRQLGLLQIDFVNVLVPAHYMVPFSRLGAYDRALLDDLVYRRREFVEVWAHEASIVPMDRWPLLRYRTDPRDRKVRALTRFLGRHRAHADRVLDEVRTRGPVIASEVPEPDGGRSRRGVWWGWGYSKIALEAHFARGALAISERRTTGFARAYDLAERVVPAEHHGREVAIADAHRELLLLAARALGVGTADDLADYYRMPIRTVRGHLVEMAASGGLRQVRVEGWRDPAYMHPEAVRPRAIRARALLSPFDPVVWFRPRAERLFGFDYRIEIYVPEPKRRWGYYVLPFLLDDRLVARVDLKADRPAGRLLVQSAHLEKGSRPDAVAPALAAELNTMAGWLGLERVQVGRRGGFARALAAAVRS